MLTDDGSVRAVAGVVAVALVAALLHQLVRRTRPRVTESLADTMLVVVLAAGVACLVGLRARADGGDAVAAAALGAAVFLAASRVGDLAGGPTLHPEGTRRVGGLLLGLAAAAGVGAAVAGGPGALLALVVAGSAAAADLLGDLAAREITDESGAGAGTEAGTEAGLLTGRKTGPETATGTGAKAGPDLAAGSSEDPATARRRAAALRPLRALLPYAVLGPVALAAGRLVTA